MLQCRRFGGFCVVFAGFNRCNAGVGCSGNSPQPSWCQSLLNEASEHYGVSLRISALKGEEDRFTRAIQRQERFKSVHPGFAILIR